MKMTFDLAGLSLPYLNPIVPSLSKSCSMVKVNVQDHRLQNDPFSATDPRYEVTYASRIARGQHQKRTQQICILFVVCRVHGAKWSVRPVVDAVTNSPRESEG